MTELPNELPDGEIRDEDWSDVEAEQPWRKPFLEQLRLGATVTDACTIAGIGRRTVYVHRQKHERFALAWTDAEESGTDVMEAEAFRRAVTGVEAPVMSGGGPVFLSDPVTGLEVPMTVRKHSDVLLIFMLKARRPQKFREVYRVEQSGPDGGPIRVAVGPRSEERILELLRIAQESGIAAPSASQ